MTTFSSIPNDAQSYVELAQQLEKQKKWPQAIASYRKTLSKEPDFWQVHTAIGNLFHQQGDFEAAIAEYEHALRIFPESAETWYNLANSQADAGLLERAIECHQRAVEVKSDFHLSWKELGVLHQQQGRVKEASAAYEEALRVDPNYAEGYAGLGSLRARQGKVREAIELYRKALSLKPELHQVHSNLLFFINFDPTYGPQSIFNEYQRWNEQHARMFSDKITPHTNDRDPERRLRIGYVSPDFRDHVVGSYIEPVLAHFDREKFEIFCYSNVQRPDETTARLRSHSAQWRDISRINDEEAARMVREDQIDVLVDLAGHMSDNRLLLFARKPAPVQVTQLGYPNTTGLEVMDYRITDSYMDPPGPAEAFHTEKIVRLPDCAFCYRALKDSPEITSLPFTQKGRPTFGSFNNFAKVSDGTIALWARILKKLPEANLLILIQGGEENKEAVRKRFEPHGIGLERLSLFHLRPRRAYLELHNQVDISLDPFPYNGGITTFESLWMGVPVVTLEGKTSCGRHGVSIYHNLGMTDLIAKSEEEYFQIAVSLARDTGRLKNLRQNLREQIKNSPLMNEPTYTRDLQAVYRQIWKKWICTT